MNLHISAPSVFIDSFYKNLIGLDLVKNNRIILRSEKKHDHFPSAPLYSDEFKKITGNTIQYDKVFIHQFSPLMYKWVARNEFKELSWMVWGADLYNLAALENQFYEPLTRNYSKVEWDFSEVKYKIKVALTAQRFRKVALGKVDHILTWMKSEFLFVKEKLNVQDATHKFFFYENPYPYHQLNSIDSPKRNQDLPVFVVGNSGTKANNHLDTLDFLNRNSIQANVIIPISYGDKKYISYLKRNANRYACGKLVFIEKYMEFDNYVRLLQSADGLIMNTLRPQGYGNIFMMMCMGKPVFINPKNVSLNDLTFHGIRWNSLHDLLSPITAPSPSTIEAIGNLLSHEKLERIYRALFS